MVTTIQQKENFEIVHLTLPAFPVYEEMQSR